MLSRLALLLLALLGAATPPSPTTTLASRSFDGSPAITGAESREGCVSADGRFVAFVSNALNLATVAPGTRNVFVRDRQTGQVELISRSSNNTPGEADSFDVSISYDGRYVCFCSFASNLTTGDTNSQPDAFIRDRLQGTTERASLAPGGVEANDGIYTAAVSGDGRWLAFESRATNLVPADTNEEQDVFVRDRVSGAVERVNVGPGGAQADGESGTYGLAISGDGSCVAFVSFATNLAPGDTNGVMEVFLRDRAAGVTERLAVSPGGEQGNGASRGPSLSADGKQVAFDFEGDNLFPGEPGGVFLRDRQSGGLFRMSAGTGFPGVPGDGQSPAVSPDGRFVAFNSFDSLVPEDANGVLDVFVRDRLTGITERASVPAAGGESEAGVEQAAPAISADGQVVVFGSAARDLVPPDGNTRLDVFVRNRSAAVTQRVSLTTTGEEPLAGAHSSNAAISADGRFVAFASDAVNLVPGDTNLAPDVFVWDRITGAVERISVSSTGAEGNGPSSVLFADFLWDWPAISGEGRFVAFSSVATNLAPDDTNRAPDIFVRDRLKRTTERVSLGASGQQLRRGSWPLAAIAISRDGRVVAFGSDDPNVVPGDTNGTLDFFVRDRQSDVTERVSVATGGAQTQDPTFFFRRLSLSADGRYAAFDSGAASLIPGDTNGVPDVFVRDRSTGATERAGVGSGGTQPNSASLGPALSADGRYLAFTSYASNLAPGVGGRHIYLRDRLMGTTEWVSRPLAPDREPAFCAAAALSDTGRFVAFRASLIDPFGPNVVGSQVCLRDRAAGATSVVPGILPPGGAPSPAGMMPALSADARYLAFASAAGIAPGDSAGTADVYVHDRAPSVEGGKLNAPKSLNFGRAAVGVVAARALTVANLSGTEALLVTADVPQAPFFLTGEAALLVPPGGSRSFTLDFRPTRKGRAAARLTLHTSDPRKKLVRVNLSGAGLPAP